MSKDTAATNGGIGFIGIAFITGIVFVILKLCGVITWSWFYVILPFIIGVSMVGLGILFILAFIGLGFLIAMSRR